MADHWRCDKCNQDFQSQDQYERHNQSQHQGGSGGQQGGQSQYTGNQGEQSGGQYRQ